MAKLPKEVQDVLNNPGAVKVIGTVDKQKGLNLSALLSAEVLDDETLVFVDADMGKTKQNLEATKRATITCFQFPMQGYQVKGMFGGWQTSGPVFEKYSKKYKDAMAAQGVTVTPKAVGTLKVAEAFSISHRAAGFKVA
jgi:predicted pyridoxine 5'-phosphate oxidase superfamily flavin-nucleotide-binding protein